jgi:dihydroxyacetone kinase-like protein
LRLLPRMLKLGLLKRPPSPYRILITASLAQSLSQEIDICQRPSQQRMHHALEQVCEVTGAEDVPSELDGAIGDGDLRSTWPNASGVKKKLSTNQGKMCNPSKDVGIVVLNSRVAPWVLSMDLSEAGQRLPENQNSVWVTCSNVQVAEGILVIGKAKLGDKTLIDTLSPAVRCLEKAEKESRPLSDALAEFQEAAKKGMESTKEMVAKMGRASRLGERTLGHQDAGATSCYLILRSMAIGLAQDVKI